MWKKNFSSECFAGCTDGRTALTGTLSLLNRVKKKENDKDEDVKEDEREPKDRRCFQCGDMGHVRRDCPEFRHLKQRTPGAPGTSCTARSEYCRPEGDLFLSLCGFGLLTLSSLQVPHPVRTMASSQSIPIPQSSADSLGRTRQASECVSTGEIQVIFLNHFARWCL